jgi:hypothetical protein
VEHEQKASRPPTRNKIVVAAGGVLGLATLLIVIVGGYLYQWEWSGLTEPKRTLWDWLDLLIVPVVLALGGYLFTRSENQRTQDVAERQRRVDREIADQRTEIDRELADQRRQDDLLQAYLDQMGELVTDKDRPLHRAQMGDRLSMLARARTLSVLNILKGGRKVSVLLFLYESGLIVKRLV